MKTMKKFQILALLLVVAAALSTACQRSLDREDSQSFDGEKGYVSLSLNLPTVSGTKLNDDFDDGDEEEYEVKEAIVAFFYGADEATAVCKYAISIEKDGIFAGPADDNITSTFVTGAVEVPAKEANENVYALAVLNPISGLMSVTGEGDLTLNGKSEDLMMTDFQVTLDASALAGHDNGFMMTNAPVYDATDGIVTLTPVTVYTEKSHVENAAPDKIYVERVEAKVTLEVSKDATDNTLTVEDGTFDGATVKIDGWYLQNTNRKYYPVRKTNVQWLNAENYGAVENGSNRFVGTYLPQRIYWAEDHNYDEAVTDENLASEFNIVTDVPASWNAVGAHAYCAENTTTAKIMNKKQLTGVLISATYTPSGLVEGESFLITGQFNIVYSEAEFEAWVLATLDLPSGIVQIIAEDGDAVTDAGGLKGLLTIDGNAPTDDQAAKLLVAADNSIKYYKDGVSYYYSSIIRHFDNEQTPLEESVADVSEYDENKHLGRYGVVRNNWYQLTVKSVSGPGEPEIPEIPDEPADARTSYINCEINVLSWAVREQEIDL